MRRGVLLLAVGLLAPAGCSEPQQASDTLPTAATTTSAEPTLEPLGPADFPVPADARAETEAGALALGRYYVELTSRSTENLDSTWMRQLSSNCETCDDLAQSYDLDRQDGNRLQGCELQIASYSGPFLDGDNAEMPVVINQEPCLAFGPDGAELIDRQLPSVQLTGGLSLVWDSTRFTWVVTQLNVQRT